MTNYVTIIFSVQCFRFLRYVEKNISDYRTQYFRRNTHKTLPPCLCEKTDSFTNRILQRIEAVRTLRYTVNQVQTGKVVMSRFCWTRRKNHFIVHFLLTRSLQTFWRTIFFLYINCTSDRSRVVCSFCNHY